MHLGSSSRFIFAVFAPSALALSLASCAGLTAADSPEQSSAADEAAALCGNNVRDDGEQCDDGNKAGNDGCSSTCRFEQVHRMNSMQMVFATDANCSANALGGAVGSQAQGQLQSALGDAVTDGTINVLFGLAGMTDLTGVAAAQPITLSSFIGLPEPGVNPGLDTWYKAQIDHSADSHTTLGGSVGNSILNAGPGNINFALAFGGAGGQLAMSGTKATAKIGASSVPTVSSGTSPGHVAGEHLDPALKSFASLASGELCGNISAASLAGVPAPSQITSGSTSCSQGYTSENSLLDVFVGGCTVFIVQAFKATQPDKGSDVVSGGGAPYKLTAGSNHKVNGCKDKNGAAVDMSACLKSAAYSAAFKFTTQRVVVKGEQN